MTDITILVCSAILSISSESTAVIKNEVKIFLGKAESYFDS